MNLTDVDYSTGIESLNIRVKEFQIRNHGPEYILIVKTNVTRLNLV